VTGLRDAPCGTDRAYRQHLANGEDCATCRTANAERARQDDKKRARARAQSRALNALARCFPIEYNALYQQELGKAMAALDGVGQEAA
jgi:hypothetical protein